MTDPETRLRRRLAPPPGGPDDCWVWPGKIDKEGYGRIRSGGRGSHDDYAHRVAYRAYVGPIPDGEVVRHKVCDNPPCVNPRHLLTGTAGDNNRDAVEHGRNHRRSPQLVNEIFRLRAEGLSQRAIAARVNRSQGVVWLVLKGTN